MGASLSTGSKAYDEAQEITKKGGLYDLLSDETSAHISNPAKAREYLKGVAAKAYEVFVRQIHTEGDELKDLNVGEETYPDVAKMIMFLAICDRFIALGGTSDGIEGILKNVEKDKKHATDEDKKLTIPYMMTLIENHQLNTEGNPGYEVNFFGYHLEQEGGNIYIRYGTGAVHLLLTLDGEQAKAEWSGGELSAESHNASKGTENQLRLLGEFADAVFE